MKGECRETRGRQRPEGTFVNDEYFHLLDYARAFAGAYVGVCVSKLIRLHTSNI